MKTININCAECGTGIVKRLAEYRRQKKKNPKRLFFCDEKCSALYYNRFRGDLKVDLQKICPHCKETFKTRSGKGEATFCSRSCASAGSVTDLRRNKAREVGNSNLEKGRELSSVASTLRKREAWKYTKIRIALDLMEVSYLFEYPLEGRIFDLALLDKKILVEFDGLYHKSEEQVEIDQLKNKIASEQGWVIERIETEDAQIIPPNCIKHLI